jgi:hypothetical protein
MRTTPRFRRLILFSILSAALASAGAVFFYLTNKAAPENVLEILDSSSRAVFGKWPLEEKGEFAIEFIHSVNMSPVRENFFIEGKRIRLLSARFFSFGAGMQSDLEEGWTLERDGDALVITGYTTSWRELNYIVGTVSDHVLYINGETVSLRDLCGRNAHITLRVK